VYEIETFVCSLHGKPSEAEEKLNEVTKDGYEIVKLSVIGESAHEAHLVIIAKITSAAKERNKRTAEKA